MSNSIMHVRRLMEGGQPKQARRALARLIRQQPDDARAWALMLRLAQTPEQALECAEQVLRLKPGDPWALRQRRRLLEQLAANGEPTPTLRLPPVPDAHEAYRQFLWQAVRVGVNVLVTGPTLAVRQAIIEALAQAIPADRYPLWLSDLSVAHNPTNRTPHHLITTVDDDDMLTLLAWLVRTSPFLVAGIQAESAEQGINRFQFFASMSYTAAERPVRQHVPREAIPQAFAAGFPLVVAGERHGADSVITAVAEPVPGDGKQMVARLLWQWQGDHLRPTGLRPSWLDDYPIRLEEAPYPNVPVQALPTPLSQPTPRPDLSHKAFTQHSQRPTFPEEEEPPRARLVKPQPPPIGEDPRRRWLLAALLGGIALLVTGLFIIGIVLLVP